MAKIRPLHDRILVKRIEEEKSKGGIIIPDTAKEKPQEGKVIAVGQRAGSNEKGTEARARRQEGRHASCSASTPAPRSSIDGEEYLILREDDVLAVIE